jgi:hypothetical protein
MYTYTIQTETAKETIQADTVDEAACWFVSGQFGWRPRPGSGLRALKSQIEMINGFVADGARATIKSDDAPDGAVQIFGQ